MFVFFHRAYAKTQSQRLLRTFFLAWHETKTSTEVQAIQRFSERIGLNDQPDGGSETYFMVAQQTNSFDGLLEFGK